MTAQETENLNVALRFIKAVEDGMTGAALDEFYDEEVIQIEYPNTLTKNLTTRGLEDLKAAADKGQTVITKQEYDIRKTYSYENVVILEVMWTGTLAVPLGKIPVGGQVKAYFAQFYEFSNGRIVKQRNYDCFEPFM